jgi:hypothetical protein
MARIGETALAVGIVALATFLLLPREPRRLPAAPLEAIPGSAPREPGAEPVAAASIPPTIIAGLFGWKERTAPPPAAAKPRAAAAKPVPQRLRMVGFVESDDGTVKWIFKDTQTGTVVSLAPGATNRGWTLLEAGEQEFRLSFQDTIHVVPRR